MFVYAVGQIVFYSNSSTQLRYSWYSIIFCISGVDMSYIFYISDVVSVVSVTGVRV